ESAAKGRPDPEAALAPPVRDPIAEAPARGDAAEQDPELTLAAPSAVTRPEAPAFNHGEELTITVPRPVTPAENVGAADSDASPRASSPTLQRTTRDTPALETGVDVADSAAGVAAPAEVSTPSQ